MMHFDPVSAPTCPMCGTNDKVRRDKMGGGAVGNVHARLVWVCSRCWSVFAGSQQEWERSRSTRERRRQLVENGYALAVKETMEEAG